MANIPTTPPVIHPLPQHDQARPLWSVMIPVYNNGEFLRETLESVLQQGIPEDKMQVEVVDDASTDIDVQALVNTIGNGRVKYFRQPRNVGSLANFETCINRSRGRLVHLLHGDDKVCEGYYRKMEELFTKYPDAGAAFCRYRCIDEHGNKVYTKGYEMRSDGLLQDWLMAISVRQRTQYAAMTVRREVYEKLGAFYGVVYGEDWEMWARIARSYPVAYTPELLAFYRKHSNSISSNKILTGEYLQDLQKVMEQIQHYVPEDKKRWIMEQSKRFWAYYGLKVANDLWERLHDSQLVAAQIKQALDLSNYPSLHFMIMRLKIKIALYRIWSRV